MKTPLNSTSPIILPIVLLLMTGCAVNSDRSLRHDIPKVTRLLTEFVTHRSREIKEGKEVTPISEFPEVCQALEDIVEQTYSEFLERDIDLDSPRFKTLDCGLILTLKDESDPLYEEYLGMDVYLSPVHALALEYLAIHLGPEKADELDYEDEYVQDFLIAFENYVNADENAVANAKANVRLIEGMYYRSVGLTLKEVKAHDTDYDASISSLGGLSIPVPLIRSTRCSEHLINIHDYLNVLFHELSHHIIEKETLFFDLFKFISNDEAVTINETSCDAIGAFLADEALNRYFPDEEIGKTMKVLLLPRNRIFRAERQEERVKRLFFQPRGKLCESTTIDIRYGRGKHRSNKEKINFLLKKYGLKAFIALTSHLFYLEDLNRAYQLAVEDNAFDEVLDAID